jgi:5-methylcytosine-specific restriction endonuclease McrA
MSKGWAGGSTWAYRKLRRFVLARDNYLCQLHHPGCTTIGNQLHHLDGVRAGKVCPPNRAVASCANCNIREGDPTKTKATTARGSRPPADPPPNPPRTNW